MTQYIDPRFGHITLHDDSGHYATITDSGDVCSVEHAPGGFYAGELFTVDQATELGSALIAWAARKRLARKAR